MDGGPGRAEESAAGGTLHVAGDPPRAEGRAARTSRWWLGVAASSLATLGVFFVHFRPWQGGLLEDWGLALAWEQEGLSGFSTRLPSTLGRPLHLVPQYVGMAVSDGGFVGQYAVLGIVAVAQLFAALWVMRHLTRAQSVRWAVALAIAVHPWWMAGDILRFLPGQVAVLGVVVWAGAGMRYLENGRPVWALLVVVAPAVGLLTYQAPAVTLMLASVVVALVAEATWVRRAVFVGLTVATVGAVLAWSMVVAPRLSPQSYENQFLSGNLDVGASLRAIARTIGLHAPALVFAMLAVGALVVGLGFSGRLPQGRAWVLLLAVALAPLAAMAYASQPLHLNDPERVSLPVGLVLWVVLCCAAPALSRDTGLRRGLAGGVLVLVCWGALAGYGVWTSYTTSQQELLSAVDDVRADLTDGAQLVVADHSGRFGDVYLFLPPYLNVALDLEDGPGADAVLCTVDGVVRDQPAAALFPIGTTPDCSTVLVGGDVVARGNVTTLDGVFDLYEVQPAG